MYKFLVIFHLLLLAVVIESRLPCQEHPEQGGCSDPCIEKPWGKSIARGCTGNPAKGAYQNLPILNGAYCFNNGTGLCKGFAGRFEFYFNTFQDKFIGPVPAGEFVDSNGYHQRVPVSYSIDGRIMYADRSINWASLYADQYMKSGSNLLNSNTFSWCEFVVKNFWPYKSAIPYYNKDEGTFYQVFFYNRQTCIFNNKTERMEFYNSRFMYKSNLKIDLDTNPTVFAMEDNMIEDPGRRVRLVKHKREWWYEVDFNVSSKNNATVYIDFEMRQDCKICKIPVILTKEAYGDNYKFCLSDHHSQGWNQAELTDIGCGMDQIEVADHNYVASRFDDASLKKYTYEVTVHNIPRYWENTMDFFGVKDTSTDWERLDSDGIAFSALTSFPAANPENSVEVIAMYARYKPPRSVGQDSVERLENYPIPYISRYIATYNPYTGSWKNESIIENRLTNEKLVSNLNYIDDIAYLYACPSILVVFGPFYTQFPHADFGPKTLELKTQTDSIIELGMYEIPSAIIAVPDTNRIWAYYRTNFVAAYEYKCKGNGKRTDLISATKALGGHYYQRYGHDLPGRSIYPGANLHPNIYYTTDRSEETFFYDLGLFPKSYSQLSHEAPDPRDYPLKPEDDPVITEPDNTWLYIMIVVGIAIIVIMCIVCVLTLRRMRQRQKHDKLTSMMTKRSGLSHSGMSSRPTIRNSHSGFSSEHGSKASSQPTARSSRLNKSPVSSRTVRSGIPKHSSRSSGHKPSSGHGSFHLSHLGKSTPSSSQTVRSKASGLKQSGSGSPSSLKSSSSKKSNASSHK